MNDPRLTPFDLWAGRPLPRKAFLLHLSAGAVLLLAGCGDAASLTGPGTDDGNGDGDQGTGAGGGTGGLGVPGTPVSSAQRVSSIQGVEAELRRLIGTGRRYDPAGMLDFLGKQSAFSAIGYNERATCAWAVYTDGRICMIANGVPASASPVAPAPAFPPRDSRSGPAAASRAARLSAWPSPRAGAEGDEPLLTADQFRSVNMWRRLPLMNYHHVTEGWVDQDTIPRVERIAEGLGCVLVDHGNVLDDSGFERPVITDVEGLKQVQDDGVFLLTTYGGYAEVNGTPVSALWTLTPALAQGSLTKGYEEDLDARRLVYFTAPPSGVDGDATPLTSLGITPDFARHYQWSFPGGSLVYLNTTGDTLADWLSPLQAAGARVVLGWVGAAALRTMLGAAQDFFELVFATNHVNPGWVQPLPNQPRLRSYGIGEIRDYLFKQGVLSGVEVDGAIGRLEWFRGADFVNQIRPTIEYLIVDEINGLMQVQGQFGDTMGSVRIGSATDPLGPPELAEVADQPLVSEGQLAMVEWLPHVITVELPEQQRGMVQVWIGGRYSNLAHLTCWTVTFQINRTVGGTLVRSVTMEVSFRAFVSGYRLWPDQPPEEQWTLVPVLQMAEANIGWSASGSLSRSESGVTTTVSWSGAGDFSRNAGGESFSLIGMLRVPERRLECRLDMMKVGGLHVRTESSSDGGTGLEEHDEAFRVKTPGATFPSFGALELAFADDWSLQAGSARFTDNDESVLGEDACETQVTWGAVVPEFGPEDDRGGR